MVSRVEVIDKISLGKLATEYRYHHGYWDGGEREFRGFGRVDQRDTETHGDYNAPGLHNGLPLTPSEGGGNLPPPVGGGAGGGPTFFTVPFEHYTPPTETRNWFHLGPIGDEFGDWKEVEFSDEYWHEDLPAEVLAKAGPNVLARDLDTINIIKSVPRRAKRDAYRTLAGSQLRTELYALDKPGDNGEYVPGPDPNNPRPYTVTESQYGLRLEAAPAGGQSPFEGGLGDVLFVPKETSGYIFFSFATASRTTQWERGNDPMTQFSFTADYDQYGQPLKQLAVAIPRGILPPYDDNTTGIPAENGGGKMLSTLSVTTYAQKDEPVPATSLPFGEGQGGAYMVDRVCRAISYEVIPLSSENVFELKERVLQATLPIEIDTLQYKIIGCTLNFYDGDAFTGLGYQELGDYGALVRSETLVLTEDIIQEAYDSTPIFFANPTDENYPSDAQLLTAGYPQGFIDAIQNDDNRLGYQYYDSDPHTTGFYTITKKIKYDFQDGGTRGLVTETRDPFDNASEIEYDQYELLPEKAHQVIDSGTSYKLTTEAEYDYRVLQAKKITDPNGNRSEFGFTPLGLLERSAVKGKTIEAKGDTLEHPSVLMEYDFFAFKNHGQPVWVKTIQRINHWQDSINDETIEAVEYTDGFGRLLQTRTLAEDVIFGDSVFGDSGLPAQQGSNGSATGIQRAANSLPNVRVSGWQVYNNKGKVVEQYEPFFARGFAYSPPSGEPEGAKIRMYYDPRGQVVRTINPDNSEQRVIFGIPGALNSPPVLGGAPAIGEGGGNNTPTPWESYTYDANDLASITHKNQGFLHTHKFTPSSVVVDALGRTVKTTERLGQDKTDEVVMKYEYDIRGNVLEIEDALSTANDPRVVFEHTYDLANQSLYTKHIDANEKWVLYDCTGKPIELEDKKGSKVLNAYDTLNRPKQVWAKDLAADDFTVRQFVVYGDDQSQGPANPEDKNYLGKPYKQYDESGLNTILEYDFKGNVLSKKKEVIKDSLLLTEINNGSGNNWVIDPYRTDWTDAPWDEESNLLEGNYETDMKYDALNRSTEVKYPADKDAVRKILQPTYNRAGSLQKVVFNGVTYVEHLAYNAKGQRLLLAFGNDIMTRYTYDNQTFRLKRLRTESYIKTDWEFASDGSLKEDRAYTYDLVGNIIATNDQCTDCGLPANPDELLRQFKYDSLYRLKEATGRECNSSTTTPWGESSNCADPNNSQAYTRKYNYDKMGNLLSMQHVGSSGFTRIFNPDTGGNPPVDYGSNNLLNKLKIGANEYEYYYDDNGNLIQENANRFFEWDAFDRMRVFYNSPGGGSAPTIYEQYLYDAGGQRVKKLTWKSSILHDTVVYIDGIFEYIMTDNNGTVDEKNLEHIMDDTRRIATFRTGSIGDDNKPTKYYLEDHLQSSVQRLDESGADIDREEFYPYGESSLKDFGKKRYRYCGKEKDSESGLYYYGARYYAPWTCRFISVDPLAADYPYLTPYNYAGNKPITHKDIDGLQSTGDKPVEGGGGNQQGGNGQGSNPTTEKLMEKIDGIIRELKENKELTEQEAENLTIEGLKNVAEYLQPGVADLSESEKQDVFKSSTNGTIGILLHEFATGTGPESRTFTDDHAITGSIMAKDFGQDAIEAFYEKNQGKEIGNLEQETYQYKFSPNGNASEGFNAIQSALEHAKAGAEIAMNDDFLRLFLGGTTFTLTPNGDSLSISMRDDKSRSSLFLHAGSVWDKAQNKSRATEGNKPLTTTKQTYNSTQKIDAERLKPWYQKAFEYITR